jgi:hypothetical protein
MRKKAVQQGRSERRGESYSVPYVEPLSDARTPLAVFFRILLEIKLSVTLGDHLLSAPAVCFGDQNKVVSLASSSFPVRK